MSFLAPLFLLGALGVGLPILIHLIRRTSRETTPFSSLMFLLPTPPRVTRRSRLENIWLLILRCIVLCLLALGFARPYFQKPLVADPQAGGGKKVLLLLDTSASMRRSSLWSQAQARAEEVLSQTSPADQVAVFTFDGQVQSIISFGQWSSMGLAERLPMAIRRLQQITPGWSGTHLGNALIAAAESFEESGDRQMAGKQIVLISDLQEGSRLDGLQGYEWPRGVELVVHPVKVKRSTNAGLQLVTDEALHKAELDAQPRMRVVNAADSKREQFQLSWAQPAGNEIVGTRLDVYVPPGQSRVVTAPKPPAGILEEKMRLIGDDEEFDNTIYLVPPETERVNILFLGNDPESDPAQALYYLKRAFQETRRQVVQITPHPAGAPLAPTEIAGAQLVLITEPLPDDSSKAVKKFLNDGKTVLCLLKNVAAAQTIARLLDLPNVVAEEASVSGYAMFGQIDFEHPLFAPFADSRYSDFTKIHFWKYRRLALEAIPNGRAIARYDNGSPAFIHIPAGKGTLLVLTSGWYPADSQLALSSKFVPLLYSILEQSGGIKAPRSQYFVGDQVPLPPRSDSQPVTIHKPDGSEVSASGKDSFSQTDMPGIYQASSGQAPLRFAVNLSAEESKTAPLSLEELERLGVPLKHQSIASAKQIEQKRKRLQAVELENRQKLWRWFIVAALLVLLMETGLAGWITRRAASQLKFAS